MDYSIRPEEHELRKAKEAVEEALETSEQLIREKRNLTVSLGWNSRDYTRGKLRNCEIEAALE